MYSPTRSYDSYVHRWLVIVIGSPGWETQCVAPWLPRKYCRNYDPSESAPANHRGSRFLTLFGGCYVWIYKHYHRILLGTPILYLKAGPEACGAASLFGIGPAPTFPCHCGASLGAKPQWGNVRGAWRDTFWMMLVNLILGMKLVCQA